MPSALIPKVWGMPQSQISSYMEFDNNGGCIVGGNRTLSDAYIQRLVHAMEVLYYEKNGIHPLLVADAKLYLYPDNALFCAKPAMVLEKTKVAVQEGRLYRCLVCRALCELNRAEEKWPSNNSAVCNPYFQKKDSNLLHQDYIMRYDALKSNVIDTRTEIQQPCNFCASQHLRKVTNDGTVIYKAEDKDNLDRSICMYEQADESISQKPKKEAKATRISLKMAWNGVKVEEEISYLEIHNTKANLNQFVKDLSKKLIQKLFSDKSTDGDLQTYIVAEIWKLLEKYNIKRGSDLSLKTEFKRQDYGYVCCYRK